MRNDRFEVVIKEGSTFTNYVQVLVDRETGVNYLFVMSGYGGGLTVLLDEDGKPVITKK